jgi:hypothetical protein
MAIRTITLTGTELEVHDLDGTNLHIRNDGTSTIYASKKAGITPGADGVASIPAGQASTIRGTEKRIYLTGTGSVFIQSDDYVENPFKTSTASGGSGVDEQVRTALNAHVENTNVHVTASEKSSWLKWIPRDMDIIDDPTYESPYESYINDTDAVNLGIVSQNNGSYWHILYLRALPGMGYGLQIAMPLNAAAGMPCYRKSEGAVWDNWRRFADGGNSLTLEDNQASDFVLKADYDALTERVSALENAK